MINISPEDIFPLISPSLTLEEIANTVSNKDFKRVNDIDVERIVSEKTSEITVDVSIEDDPEGVAVAEGFLNDRSLTACNKGIIDELSETLSGGQILFEVAKENLKAEARQKLSLLDGSGPFFKIKEEFNGAIYDWLTIADQLDMVNEFLEDVCRSRSKEFLTWAFNGELIPDLFPNSMDDLKRLWCRKDLSSSVLGPLTKWISTPEVMSDPKVQAVWLSRKLENDSWCKDVEERGFVFELDKVNWDTFLHTDQWLYVDRRNQSINQWSINKLSTSEAFVSSPKFLSLMDFLPKEKLHQLLDVESGGINTILIVASDLTRKKALTFIQEYLLETGTLNVSTGVTRSLNRL